MFRLSKDRISFATRPDLTKHKAILLDCSECYCETEHKPTTNCERELIRRQIESTTLHVSPSIIKTPKITQNDFYLDFAQGGNGPISRYHWDASYFILDRLSFRSACIMKEEVPLDREGRPKYIEAYIATAISAGFIAFGLHTSLFNKIWLQFTHQPLLKFAEDIENANVLIDASEAKNRIPSSIIKKTIRMKNIYERILDYTEERSEDFRFANLIREESYYAKPTAHRITYWDDPTIKSTETDVLKYNY